MASLDDIWDAPAEPSSRPHSPPRPGGRDGSFSPGPATKRPASSRPLFLDSGSDDDAPTSSKAKSRYASKPGANKPDIDAFFDNLDDDPDTAFQDLAPSLDIDALKRQVDAKIALTPHQILPSSSPPRDLGDDKPGARGKVGEKKGKEGGTKKKKRPVLDEGKLCGPDGFPALVKQAKEFKPKGKGHELQDLNRLMNVYQFWAHKMYPNTQFIDTVQRVEKLCHSKRMNVALSVWRDEAKGLINGRKVPGPDDPLDSDSDASDRPATGAPRRAGTHDPQDVPVATDDERSSPNRARPQGTHRASLPPSSPSSAGSSLGALDDDFDIDAMIREDEAARAQAASGEREVPKAAYGAPRRGGAVSNAPVDEDEAMWDAVMDDFPDEPYVPPAPQQPVTASGGGGMDEDMDEDIWDMVREMDAEGGSGAPAGQPAAPPPASGAEKLPAAPAPPQPPADGLAGVDPSRKATVDEGWDEMYA